MGPVVIAAERLKLRMWEDADAPAIVELFDDPEVAEFVNDGKPIALSEAEAFITRYRRIQSERGWCRWAVELKTEPGRLAGFCGVGCTFAPEIELGWTFRRDLWGQGLATEAGRAALDYCFGNVGFERVISAIDPRNVRSAAVALRLGMRLDGTLEHDHPIDRYVIDNPMRGKRDAGRFIRNCDGEPTGSVLVPDAES